MMSNHQILEFEMGACGVGAIFPCYGHPSHEIVEEALKDFKFLEHRGGKIPFLIGEKQILIGDGAGIKLEIPKQFFRDVIFPELSITYNSDDFAVGNIFLPVDEQLKIQAQDKIIDILKNFNYKILENQWRKIPFNAPEYEADEKIIQLKIQDFRQIFVCPVDIEKANKEQISTLKEGRSLTQFQEDMIKICLEIDKYAVESNQFLAVASLSPSSIIYKGMLVPTEIQLFTDLKNPQFKSSYMSLHVRQATNTNPNPGNAQPCRQILHNGELNSVQSYALKNKMEKYNNWSDSRIFNTALEELLVQNKTVAEALTILMPPPISDDNPNYSDAVKNMLQNFRFQDKSFCGPAFIVFQIGTMQGAKLDSCGLRPSRYVITKEANDRLILHVNSEDQFQQDNIIERGILKNGEMIMVHNNKIMKNIEILEEMAKTNQFASYNIKIEKIEPDPNFIEEAFDFVQHGKFFTPTLETQKYYLNPLITSSAIKVQAMGDDTPAFKNQLHPPHLVDYFKQKFSQVSSPPLDSEKEKESFSYDTFLGSIPDITKKNEELIFQINSPILQFGEIEKVIEIGEKYQILSRISLTIDITHILDSASTNSKQQIQKLFENKMHEINTIVEYQITQENKQIIILEDLNCMKNLISMPDIMVVSELNRHLLKIQKSRQVSIIVNSTQVQKAHHISILCALGADAVNPAGLYEYAKRIAKRKCNERKDQIKIFSQFCQNIQQGFLKAHLKTMAKYGIVSTNIYNSSRLIEAVSLDLSEPQPGLFDENQQQINITLGQIFSYIQSPFGGYTFQDIVNQTIVRHLNRYELDLNVMSEGLFQYEPHGIPHVYDSKTVNLFKKLLNGQQTKHLIIEQKQIFIKQINLQLDYLEKCDEKSIILDFVQKIKDYTKELFDLKDRMQQMDELKQKSIVQCIEKIFRHCSPQIEELFKIFTVENEKDINIPDDIIKKLTTVQKNEIQFFTKEVKRIEDQFKKSKLQFEKIEKKIEGLKQIESIYFESFNENEAPTKAQFIQALQQEKQNLKNYIHQNSALPKLTEEQVFSEESVNKFKVTEEFKQFVKDLQNHRKKLPASILNEFEIQFPNAEDDQIEISPQLKQKVEDPKFLVNIDEVQSISSILKTQVVGGISFGAITTPAHYSIFLAEKLIGSGGACSGEGGQIKKKQLEPYLHFFKGIKVKSENSRIKQIASGRFGINPDFLDADVIEIKIAQGAKPGEGGQLPNSKVTVEIAAKRQSIPGIGLVSPPPHHDIYSIEDLKQLIYDLKDARPKALVCVKLCASFGIDKIALGVAKSGADIINVASGTGGTGAASTDSIKFTGMPSEVGVRLIHKYLCLAKIRDLVKIQVSGSIVGPQDIIKFAILGADMFEWGTTELILLGCAMLRKCNTQGGCTPGVTNNVKDFQGDYRNIAEFKLNVAGQIRYELARLGIRSLKELRGRTDLLKISTKFVREKFNFTELFKEIHEVQVGTDYFTSFKKEFDISSSIDIYNEIYSKIQINEFSKEKQNFILGPFELNSANRTFGAQIAIKYRKLLKKNLLGLHIKTYGNAGQSYGFLNNTEVLLEHIGVCQDGVGKSCCGGKIILITPENERKRLLLNVRAGNSVGYGASGGKIFINGKVGQRCGVLMKGATIVVEGAGDFTCEYMTSGSFMSLEVVGESFANGMYGGIAVLYNNNKDKKQFIFETNKNYCYVQRVSQEESNKYFLAEILALLKEFHLNTKSIRAAELLQNWENEKENFVVFVPKSLLSMKSEKEIRDVEAAFNQRDFKIQVSGFEQCWLKFQKDRIALNPDRFVLDLKLQSQQLYEKYAKIAQKIYKRQSRQEYIQQLGTLDYEEHEDNLLTKDNQEEIDYAKKQLTKQMQSYASKCSCDAVSCTGEVLDLEDLGTLGGGCPINKNPNLINEKIRQNDYEAAFKIQVQQSPFAGITGSICPAPCQYSCTQALSDQGSGKAVEIKKIEFLLHNIGIAENLYEKYKIFPTDDEIQKKNINVAVIGSGPAGMEASYHLRLGGFNVDVYEKDDLLGGLLRYGIPDHKFPKFVLDYYLKQLKKMGIKFIANKVVDENNIESLREQNKYDAFIDARGVSNDPVILRMRPTTVTKIKQAGFENIFDSAYDDDFINKKIRAHIFALDFLMYCNVYYQKISNLDVEQKCSIENPLKFFQLSGKRVLIIGAGDTAEDTKRSLSKLIYYAEENIDKKTKIITLDRQPQKTFSKPIGNVWGEKPEIASQELEVDLNFVKAKNMYNLQPVCLTYNEKKEIKGVLVEKLLPKNPGFSKQFRDNKTISNSYEEVECDVVISALGFNSKIRPLSNSIPVGSPISVVAAFASGKLKAMEYIESYKTQERIIREIYFKGSNSKEYYVAQNIKTENGTQKKIAQPLTMTLLSQFKQELQNVLQHQNGKNISNEDEIKSYSKIIENRYENSSFIESSQVLPSDEDICQSPSSPSKQFEYFSETHHCQNKLQGDCANRCKCSNGMGSPKSQLDQQTLKKTTQMSLKEILGLEMSEESKLFFYN